MKKKNNSAPHLTYAQQLRMKKQAELQAEADENGNPVKKEYKQ